MSNLMTADGEQITLGPFNSDQAPSIECSNCGGHITVGQRLVPSMAEAILGMTVHTKRLIYVTPPDQEGPAPVHSDCSAEYAHDQITHEPCERETDEVSECEFCGVEIPDGDRLCGRHVNILGLAGRPEDVAPMLERGQLASPPVLDDVRDLIDELENMRWSVEALFRRTQFKYQQNNWVTEKLWAARLKIEEATKEISDLKDRKDVFPDPP